MKQRERENKMTTLTDIKIGLRARIEGLEIMLDMYEKR